MKSLCDHSPPVLGFAAFSGTGKTTLLTQLIPLLTAKGLRIAIIKHSHHDFEIDQPGKDSYELHHAGSSQTLLTSKYRSALITENKPNKEPDLEKEIAKLELSSIDLILVEGFRHVSSLQRIELHRPSLGKPLLFPNEEHIIAIATDASIDTPLPTLDINSPMGIADFIQHWLSLFSTNAI